MKLLSTRSRSMNFPMWTTKSCASHNGSFAIEYRSLLSALIRSLKLMAVRYAAGVIPGVSLKVCFKIFPTFICPVYARWKYDTSIYTASFFLFFSVMVIYFHLPFLIPTYQQLRTWNTATLSPYATCWSERIWRTWRRSLTTCTMKTSASANWQASACRPMTAHSENPTASPTS